MMRNGVIVMLALANALVLVMLLSGCTREIVRFQLAPLYLPEPPTLPTLARERLQCLGDDYEILFAREDLIREHRVQLKDVICTTWNGEKVCPKWEEWEQ